MSPISRYKNMKRRKLGKGRKSIKIDILPGIEEADPEYMTMDEAYEYVMANPPDWSDRYDR
jgi:hypothetical protein